MALATANGAANQTKKNNAKAPLIVPLTQSLGVSGAYKYNTGSFDPNYSQKRSSIMRLLKPSISADASITEKIIYIFVKYFFLIGLFICLLIGVLLPEFASAHGPLAPNITSSWISVIIIFFITGIAVRTKALKKATSSWQLNLFMHIIIFIMFPIFGLLISYIIQQIDSNYNKDLLKGLIITCCLPTTIGTAVVFVQNARGNEAAAVVNTTLANLLGIAICPGLIVVLVGGIGGDISIGDIALSLCLRVIVPFLCGQIIRYFLGTKIRHWMKPKKPYFKKATEICLLFIILCAISETFYEGLEASLIEIIVMAIVVALLHGLSLPLVWFLSGIRAKSIETVIKRKKATSIALDIIDDGEVENKRICCDNCFAFDIYDRIAITITATQKTVGFGLPMIETLYGNQQALIGLFIVPLLLFEIVQLIIDSLLITPFGNKAKRYAQEMYQGLLDGGITGKYLLSAKNTLDKMEKPRTMSTHAIGSLFVHDQDDL
eukprot:291999_1